MVFVHRYLGHQIEIRIILLPCISAWLSGRCRSARLYFQPWDSALAAVWNRTLGNNTFGCEHTRITLTDTPTHCALTPYTSLTLRVSHSPLIRRVIPVIAPVVCLGSSPR